MTFRDWLKCIYHTWWGCRHGRHYMKMSGCVYCGKLM